MGVYVHGEPLDVIFHEHDSLFPIAVFDGFEFIISIGRYGTLEGGTITAIRVFDPDIRFGRQQIGVGSTGRELARAYRFVGFPRVNTDNFSRLQGFTRGGGNSAAAVDGTAWLTFEFNEDDRVVQITITITGP